MKVIYAKTKKSVISMTKESVKYKDKKYKFISKKEFSESLETLETLELKDKYV